MRRFSVMLGTGIAATAVATVIATSGSAQTPSTLHLVDSDQSSVGFGPHHKPRQGERFGFGAKTTGDDTGHDRGVCTVIGRDSAICTVQVTLTKGILTAQGTVSLNGNAKNVPFAITGGTGAYNGARGTALVTDVSSNKTKIDITFL